jgi:hypothetical protein
MAIELPEEFLEFARNNSDKYVYKDLKVLLYQKHRMELSVTSISKKLKDAGINLTFKKKCLPFRVE